MARPASGWEGITQSSSRAGPLKVAFLGIGVVAYLMYIRTPESQPGPGIPKMGGLALGVSAIYLMMQEHTEV